MLTITFNLYFKNMKIIWVYVEGHSYVVIQNHCKLWHKLCMFFCCRFVSIWPWQGIGTTTNNVEDDDFFGVRLYHLKTQLCQPWKVSCNYFGNYICVINRNKNPLVWWVAHAMQFKHVSSWVHQVIGVISS
jgi:hypothetical protein